ncbi:MAG TPA: hypothetical protein VL614_28595 [Acetobacteraceae bacterium]|jgi:hypothetical protein|nr:hypothetical protein [Acetobacteraceae bacterium]
MPGLGKWPIVLCCGLLSGIAPPASAQHVILDAPSLLPQKPKTAPPTARAPTALWPRLDPGAVVCKTEDDLDRHAANMIARVSGGVQQTADCHAIDRPTGIQIVERAGPGRTQVRLAGADGETGWTDVWLPEKPPPR